MTLKGKVVSGLGEAKIWVNKIKKIFEAKTGMKLYEGTLNVKLDERYYLGDTLLKLEPSEYGGTQEVLVQECEVLNNKAYVLRTIDNENGIGSQNINVIEIVSNINFRNQYNLKDGDMISIIINKEKRSKNA